MQSIEFYLKVNIIALKTDLSHTISKIVKYSFLNMQELFTIQRLYL